MNLVRILQLLGPSGLYLYLCRRTKKEPGSFRVPIFGNIRTLHEIRNIFDNFGAPRQIRDGYIESYLSKQAAPCIIDCGVNVGVTVRWWFHLNKNARIFGIDMLKECQDFTVESVKSIGLGHDSYKPVVAALWSESGKDFTIAVHDPLCGDHSFDWKGTGPAARTVVTKTLDELFVPEVLDKVDLVKIDLEGAGGSALEGARELLGKTKHVVIEIHNDRESGPAEKALKDSGFCLRRANDRNMWWEKPNGGDA